MNIARIITKFENIDTFDFVDVTNDFSSIDDCVTTLVIGKKNAEDFFGKDKIKVLDRNITPNISWTYDKTERRSEFERDLKKFNDNLIKTVTKNIKYEYFNIFTEPISRIKKLINFIKNNKLEKYIYITDNHIYIYYRFNVFGISLNDISYLGINIDKVLNIIKSNKHNYIIYNIDFLSQKMKQIVKNNKILVPYFYFLSIS